MRRTGLLLAVSSVLGLGACNQDATVLRSIPEGLDGGAIQKSGTGGVVAKAGASGKGGVPNAGSGGTLSGAGGEATVAPGGTSANGGATTANAGAQGSGGNGSDGGGSTGGASNDGGSTANGGVTSGTGGNADAGSSSGGATPGDGGATSGDGGASTGIDASVSSGGVASGSGGAAGNADAGVGSGGVGLGSGGTTSNPDASVGNGGSTTSTGGSSSGGGTGPDASALVTCGDGVIDGARGETCDDGNTKPNDGCDGTCLVETDYQCKGSPSICWKDGPSCNGLPKTCGASGDEDCCESSIIPGGTFIRENGTVGNLPATVSTYRLDKYEITVGRFRKFVASFPGSMPAGSSGINANVSVDPGWNPIWNGSGYLPQDQATFDSNVKCSIPAWTNWTVGDDNLPMNCIDWYEAYAFCIWDGGHLPTELEWNYAAAGGSDQRPYPWSTSPTDMTIDPSYAVYAPAAAVYAPVGSTSPKGDGKWGQADLAGNVFEWVEDWYGGFPATCTNCANLDWRIANQIPAYRLTRGGSAGDDASFQLTSRIWYWNVPSFRNDVIGARCARNP